MAIRNFLLICFFIYTVPRTTLKKNFEKWNAFLSVEWMTGHWWTWHPFAFWWLELLYTSSRGNEIAWCMQSRVGNLLKIDTSCLLALYGRKVDTIIILTLYGCTETFCCILAEIIFWHGFLHKNFFKTTCIPIKFYNGWLTVEWWIN